MTVEAITYPNCAVSFTLFKAGLQIISMPVFQNDKQMAAIMCSSFCISVKYCMCLQLSTFEIVFLRKNI